MRKLAAVFICLGFLSWASMSLAAYLIHLKDGRTITTREYWEEGDQIKIKQFGGVVGIAIENVISIEKSDDVRSIVVKSGAEEKEKVSTESVEAEGDKKEEGKQDNKKGDDVVKKEKKADQPDKKIAHEKNPLLKELEALKEKTKGIDDMPVEALLALNRQLKNLRNKIIKAGLAGPYADQMVEIYDMIGRVEDLYHKKKNQ